MLNYTVKVSNVGDGELKNVLIEDFFDGHGKLNYIPTVGVVVNGDGTYTINKLPAGTFMELRFTYVIVEGDEPEVLNAAVVTTPPVDPPLEPTKTADKKFAFVDEIVTYTISVYNPDTKAKTNVTVKDTNNFVGSINAANTDKYTYNGDNTWTIPEIGAGETIDISSVKVGESIELHFTYVVTVSDAPQVLNAAVVKDPTPPIDVEKDADKYVAKVTDVVTYTITVRNTTDKTVNDITVSDHNNFSGSIDTVGSDRYTYNGDGTWTIGYLDADEAIDIVYTYTVETTDKSVMENTATIKYTHDGEQYNIPSNTVDVKKPDDGVVTIWKSANKTVAKPGETVTYTVTVHNGKDHDIQNAVLTDENNFSGSIFAVEGAGYHYENGMFTIDTIPAGGDVVVHYAYTVGIADVPTNILENIATIHVPGTNPEDPENPGQGKDPTKPIDPDTDIPSNKVDVEVPGSGTETDIPLEKSLTIVKSADKTKVNVGETINYRVVVTNTGEVDLVNVSVKDNNNGASHIVATSGNGYTYDDATAMFTIDRIPVGESFTLTYSYVAVDADAGHDVINVAVAKAPGQNPEDPENPGHGKDPSKPIDEDVEKPSNEVKVPVVKPSTPVTPDEPKPTPTPSNPTNPTPTPAPSEKPTNPIQGIVSIITGNKKTGIGFVQGIAGLAAVVGVGLIALVVVNHKRKKDTDNDEDKHNNESAE